MFCMPEAFKGKLGIFLAYFSAFLLCIYGAEVYQFTVIVDTLDEVIPISREWLILPLLGLIVYIGLGGIKRLADVCAFLMPGFIVLYVAMCAWVIGMHYELLPTLIADVFKSAFMGHAALGGFAGSTIIMAAQQGAQRAVYSGDIAVGFDSIIQSETKELNPQRQARLAIVAALSDAFICTLSIVVVYMTGLWKMGGNLLASNLVATSLEAHIPYADWLIVLIIFLAGFTTIQAYFSVGLKAAKFISRRWGRLSYFIYAIASLWVFSHYDQTTVIVIMSLSGGLLILVNISCIFKLRKEIRFDVLKEDSGE